MTNMKETGNFSVECDDQVIVTQQKQKGKKIDENKDKDS